MHKKSESKKAQRLLCSGLMAGLMSSAAVISLPSAAWAACPAVILTGTDGCTISTSDQAVTPTPLGTNVAPDATALAQVAVLGSSGPITIERGAGLISNEVFAPFSVWTTAVPAYYPDLPSLTVDGEIATTNPFGVVIQQDGDFLLSIGTNAGDTFDTSHISVFNRSMTDGVAVLFGGRVAGYYDPTSNPTEGNFTVNIGSSTGSSGGIVYYSENDVLGTGIMATGMTGDVTINNVHGKVLAKQGIYVNTSGDISITNGFNADVTSTIQATGGDYYAAIFTGWVSIPDPVARVPSSISIVNNIGSLIDGGVGGTGIAIFNDVSTTPGANTITNYGTIIGTLDQDKVSAAILLNYKTGTGGVAVDNYGTITGGIYLQNSNDVVNMRGGTITGNITAPTDQGRVSVYADSRFNGTVYSATSAINAAQGMAHDYNFGKITLKANAVLTVGQNPENLQYTGDVPLSILQSDIETDTDGTGSVKFLQATRFTHKVGTEDKALGLIELVSGISTIGVEDGWYANLTKVDANAQLFLAGEQEIHGNFESSGTIDLAGWEFRTKATNGGVAGNFTTLGGRIVTTLWADGTHSGVGSDMLGHVLADGSITIMNGTSVDVETDHFSDVTSGARYILASGTSAATLGTTNVALSGDWNWGLLRGDSLLLGQSANDVYLVADPASLAKTAFTTLVGSGSVSGSVIDSIGNLANDTTNTQAQLLFGSLAGLSSAQEVETALKKLTPDGNGSGSAGAANAVGAVTNVIGNRSNLIVVSMGDGDVSGVSAGDAALQYGLWAQPFGFYGDQSERNGFDGYTAKSGGIALGVDNAVDDNLALGLSLAYASTSVQNDGALAGNSTDIDSYQATLYGVYDNRGWFLESQLGYSTQRFNTSRFVTVGLISENPRGNFDGSVGTASIGIGKSLSLAHLNVMPRAGLTYSYMSQDGYTETNAPTTGLVMAKETSTSLKSSFGFSVSKGFKASGGTLQPELRVAWQHEFHDGAPTSTASFAFGGTTFNSSGSTPEVDSFVPGIGLTYVASNALTMSATYDAEIKNSYFGNTATIKLKYVF